MASNPDNIDDAIDSGVFRAVKEVFGADGWAERRSRYTVTKSVGFNPTVKRTLAFCTDTETGDTLLVAKGLLTKVLDTGDDGAAHQWQCADLEATTRRARAADEALSEDAFKTIAVGVRYNDGPMRFAGIVPMRDPPRHDTGETIAAIRASGVGVKARHSRRPSVWGLGLLTIGLSLIHI